MNVENTHHGKILNHGKGTGELTPEAIERRADEIALIDGRSKGTPSREDLRQARDELMGADLHAVTEDDMASTTSLNRDPGDPVAIHGKQVPVFFDDDEQETVERLALEGVEEAQHEQMLADRMRKNPNS